MVKGIRSCSQGSPRAVNRFLTTKVIWVRTPELQEGNLIFGGLGAKEDFYSGLKVGGEEG